MLGEFHSAGSWPRRGPRTLGLLPFFFFLIISRLLFLHMVSLHHPSDRVVQFRCSAVSEETPWTAECQASLFFTIPQNLLKSMSIGSVMASSHLVPCHPLLLLPSIFPSIRVFSNESALRIRWPKYWSLSFSISPSSGYSERLA